MPSVRFIVVRRGRDRLRAAGDHDLVHAGDDAGGRALHRRHARRAVAVERDARDLDEAELDRGVAGDVSATLQRLAHLEVVDVAGRDARALERLADRVLGEVERAHVEQRALAGGPDRRAGRGDDDCVRHWCSLDVR